MIDKPQSLINMQWWEETAELIGCTLNGFTDRSSASFISPAGNDTVNIPGWLALKIRQLNGEIDV